MVEYIYDEKGKEIELYDHRPEWMVEHRPEWMADNRPDWMADNRIQWMANHRREWMANHRPNNSGLIWTHDFDLPSEIEALLNEESC